MQKLSMCGMVTGGLRGGLYGALTGGMAGGIGALLPKRLESSVGDTSAQTALGASPLAVP